MAYQIAVLGGDGIGPEVTAEAARVLEAVGRAHGHSFVFEQGLIGGIAIDTTGNPLPDETVALCQRADAVLLGAVGGPRWDDPTAAVRPEQGLLGIRKALGLYANLRPVKLAPALLDSSTLKASVLEGTDLVVVRELTGGIYFGERGRRDGGRTAFDTMVYSEAEIERVLRVAFELARLRRHKVTSVDKANVLETSRLWRSTADRVARDYPDVTCEHLLVDACAMHLIRRPASFDVIVTENMFGDILTDEASMLSGSMGMLPSASLAEGTLGLYEPIHGSAPDIAGKGIANPIGAILSAALLLRYSLKLEQEARAVEAAVDSVLAQGYRTADIAGPQAETVSTTQMGQLIARHCSSD
ncbi:MAG: 3-isopropylmalate dehydrogenase [Anaerolineae bacterium]|jgi:3-isopropylmalate dehydrogenase|nr:3-isopropylmalate dehydrogenase [Chloroflexota bacterium]